MNREDHIPKSRSTEEVSSSLTTVELLWLEKRIENRVRFGRPVAEKIVDRNRRVLSFVPGSIFAFVRWTSNDFGTVLSRIDILRAPAPGQRYSTVPWITPGGESLLRLSGWPKVERVLQLIDAVEALGIDPADAAPDYWHHVHNRLSVNATPRPYTRSRHQAWLHRRACWRCQGRLSAETASRSPSTASMSETHTSAMGEVVRFQSGTDAE